MFSLFQTVADLGAEDTWLVDSIYSHKKKGSRGVKMLLKALWVPTLVLMPKVVIAGLLDHIEQLSDIGRVGNNVIKNEARAPAPQITSHIYSPSSPQKISFGTASSHELDVSTEGLEVKNANHFDVSPMHDGLPHDPVAKIQSPVLHWEFSSEVDYQKANKELLELNNVDQSVWEKTEIKNAPKIKPNGLTDFSITNTIPGDGNCQFRAIALIVEGTQKRHERLREIVVQYMESRSKRFKPYVNYFDAEAGGSWEGYLAKLRQPNTYGDHLTLKAMAELFDRKFVVLTERPSHNGVNIIPAIPKKKKEGTAFLYLNGAHYELLLKDLPRTVEPSPNNLRGSNPFPPKNYPSNQPIRSTSSSSSYSSDSGAFRVNSFQEDPKYGSHTMELPKSQTYKVESRITPPSGQAIPENIRAPPPFSRTRTLPNGGVTNQNRNSPEYYERNSPEAAFGTRAKKFETRPVNSPSKSFKEDIGVEKEDLRLRFDTTDSRVVNGFFRSGLDIDPSEAFNILKKHYEFDSLEPKVPSNWDSLEFPRLGRTLHAPPPEQKGTSQFQAFSILIGQKGNHKELRLRALGTMIKYRKQYEPNIEKGVHGSWENYLDYMTKSDTPGDHLTLQALADTFGRRIVVVNKGRVAPKVMLQEMAPLEPDMNHPNSLLMIQIDQRYGILV